MEIKLFGKSIFEFKTRRNAQLWTEVGTAIKKETHLPDFYNEQNLSDQFASFIITNDSNNNPVAVPVGDKKKPKTPITPKGVYELKLLNEDAFEIKTDTGYIDEQIKEFRSRLEFVKDTNFDMTRGIKELSSILIRLENRKQYSDFKDFFEEYPYTTSSKIAEVIKKHDHLKIGRVEQFIPDMPREATQAMKEYSKTTEKLCEKKTIFYVIANKKDFEKTDKRKDPILLVQSPFGHFWQILGAWDKEMLLLEEL